MDKIDTGSVDLILVDLPYGTSACSWDIVIPMDALWEHYNRVLKDNGTVVLFGSEPFSSLAKYQPLKNYEDIMVFSKGAASFSKRGFNMEYNPQMEEGTPYRLVSGKQRSVTGNSTVRSEIQAVVTENEGTRYPKAILEFTPDKDKYHPTQKPVALLKYLIETYTSKGALVLDSCMGSGSTGVACKELGRKFIGIEMNEEYYNIALNRLEELWYL